MEIFHEDLLKWMKTNEMAVSNPFCTKHCWSLLKTSPSLLSSSLFLMMIIASTYLYFSSTKSMNARVFLLSFSVSLLFVAVSHFSFSFFFSLSLSLWTVMQRVRRKNERKKLSGEERICPCDKWWSCSRVPSEHTSSTAWHMPIKEKKMSNDTNESRCHLFHSDGNVACRIRSSMANVSSRHPHRSTVNRFKSSFENNQRGARAHTHTHTRLMSQCSRTSELH